MVEDTFSVAMTAPQRAPDLDWNLLLTCMMRHERDVRRTLSPVVQLRRSPFRNVFLARVDDPAAALAAIDRLAAARPALVGWLGRVLPIAATFTVDPARFDAEVRSAVAPFVAELAGRRFHVRIERRGHKGRIDSHAAERGLGTWIVETLATRGTPGEVDFDDPDLVIAIETVGDVAGIALVSRSLRERHRFVHVE